jgi:hypothetical protein
MFKRLLAVSTAMFLTLATYAFAAELTQDHPSTYTVQKGDTLWDISARFLKKPWLWPEIWQANPQVKNPHLIYPGDVLSLVYINGQPVLSSSGPHIGEAINTIPLAQIEPFLKQLTVVNDVRSLPYVMGLEDDRLLTSSGQVVYVRGLDGAQPGQLVQIVRPMHRYIRVSNTTRKATLNFRGDVFNHDYDVVNRNWEPMWGAVAGEIADDNHASRRGANYEVMLHSIGEVTQVNGELATVLLRGEERDVRVGDRILPVEDRPYCDCFIPHAAASTANGRIVATTDGLYAAGPNHVVALSVGSSDGVDNGTMFSIWHQGEVRPDIVKDRNMIAQKRDRLAMPDEFVGHVMVFRTFDQISYGLVMDGIKPARVGDLLKHPDATK